MNIAISDRVLFGIVTIDRILFPHYLQPFLAPQPQSCQVGLDPIGMSETKRH